MNGQRNILVKISEISEDDLYLIEQDLSFQEKASIAFLLFGDNKANAEVMLQKLLVSFLNKNNTTDILEHFSRQRSDWREVLVEALAIVRANKVIRKLGLQLTEVKNYFLPHIKEMSMHINELLKVLYVICEHLTPTEASDLVLKVDEKVDPKNHLRFYDFQYLEVFLLNWIAKGKLSINDKHTTDVSLLAFYFKDNSMKRFSDMLSDMIKNTISSAHDSTGDANENVTQCTESDVNEIQSRAICARPIRSFVDGNDHYEISRDVAGFALIINQRTFYFSEDPDLKDYLPQTLFKDRLGTDFDRDRLSSTFSSRGYRPIVKNNLNHTEILGQIKEIVKRSVIYHSVVICILSHGKEGCVYGVDCIPVQISAIQEILTRDELENKPKMLFIQACQGDVVQMRREQLEYDGGGKALRNYYDMIIANSTIPGYASLRSTISGSWFIQTLCDQIDRLGDQEDIMGILTAVNNAIDKKNKVGCIRMTPITSSTLKKKLRFPSRIKS